MNNEESKAALLKTLTEVLEEDEEVLFAYLYGSYAYGPVPPGSDIDVAVYLKPSDMKNFIKKEQELTFTLATKAHNDRIDLRILNGSPFLLQYSVIKEGIPLFVRDARERVDFETRVMDRFFELKPYLDEYKRMLSLKIMAAA
jgi:predicted nucleotidyltransferase